METPLATSPAFHVAHWDNARTLAAHHSAIWWLHDAADYGALEQEARALCALALPELGHDSVNQCAFAIRQCYEAYDAAQACVHDWRLADLAAELTLLRAAHASARRAWHPGGPENLEEGYYAFFKHSLFLHSPGWRRPIQKLWRNPARLAGIWRYHHASFPASAQAAVVPAVRCLFWAGLAGHDYKSRAHAETWLARYWVTLHQARVAHLFF